MASQGPNNPTSGTNDAAIGDTAWTNPGNITLSDDQYATATAGGVGTAQTNYLKGTDFGFSIPTNATIDGIVVEVERKSDQASTGKDVVVSIVKGGTVGATNKADTAIFWPTSDTYKTYGSSSDLWGETWLYSDINASTFGAVLSASLIKDVDTLLSVDHMRITVYYTAAMAEGFNIAFV